MWGARDTGRTSRGETHRRVLVVCAARRRSTARGDEDGGHVSLEPRVVVVTRPSAYRELLDRHGTPGAVRFFLRDRDPDELADLRARDDAWRRALDAVVTAVPAGWRLGRADRADLPAFGFAPGDVVVAVGPDGLVPTSRSTSTTSPCWASTRRDPACSPGTARPTRSEEHTSELQSP